VIGAYFRKPFLYSMMLQYLLMVLIWNFPEEVRNSAKSQGHQILPGRINQELPEYISFSYRLCYIFCPAVYGAAPYRQLQEVSPLCYCMNMVIKHCDVTVTFS
jgi:hypothetical protein